jgi:hypothetical protein
MALFAAGSTADAANQPKMTVRSLASAALVLALPLPAAAQSPAPLASAAAAPKPCSSAQDRQFDFWAGTWNVTDNASAKPVGKSEVTTEFGGCVLHEHWHGAGGSEGESFNHYDAARKVWHQTWVDNSGGILYLDGGLRNGSMVIEGKRTGRDGKPAVDRITYTPRPDGTVRQWWQVSKDGGKTWNTAFDGIYHRSS